MVGSFCVLLLVFFCAFWLLTPLPMGKPVFVNAAALVVIASLLMPT
jgi:hypothetical protein